MQVDHLGSIVLKFGEEQTGRQTDRHWTPHHRKRSLNLGISQQTTNNTHLIMTLHYLMNKSNGAVYTAAVMGVIY